MLTRRDLIAGSATGLAALLVDPTEVLASASVPNARWVETVATKPGPGGHGHVSFELAGHRVQFQGQGRTPWTFDSAGTGRHRLNGPTDVVCSADRVFVANWGNDTVLVLGATGRPVAEFGGWGDKPGEFRRPNALAIGPDGLLYVSDSYNHRIQALDPMSGRAVRVFGRLGTGAGELNAPGGLAFDERGLLHIADRGGRRVVVTTAVGAPVRTYGDGALAPPRSLTMGDDGHVYVADREAVVAFRQTDGRRLGRWSNPRLAPTTVVAQADRILIAGTRT